MDPGTIVAIIGTIATAIGGVFFGKRQERAKTKKIEAETDNISVEASKKAVAMWQELNEQLHNELGILRDQVNKIREENLKLHDENVKLHDEVTRLRREVDLLKKKIA